MLPERPMVGIELKLHPAAQAIEGTGGLVVERRVGGGRVVVTRFPLTIAPLESTRMPWRPPTTVQPSIMLMPLSALKDRSIPCV